MDGATMPLTDTRMRQMDVRLLYNQLLEEVHADEADLEEKRELVRLLKKRIGMEAAIHASSTFTDSGKDSPTKIQERLASVTTLAQHVAEALPKMAGRELVVGSVAETLRAAGVALPNKPNTAISTVLKRLEASGVLIRTFTGAGNVPHRYRLASEAVSTEKPDGGDVKSTS